MLQWMEWDQQNNNPIQSKVQPFEIIGGNGRARRASISTPQLHGRLFQREKYKESRTERMRTRKVGPPSGLLLRCAAVPQQPTTGPCGWWIGGLGLPCTAPLPPELRLFLLLLATSRAAAILQERSGVGELLDQYIHFIFQFPRHLQIS